MLSADGVFLQNDMDCYIRYGNKFVEKSGLVSYRVSKCIVYEVGRTRVRLVRCSKWRQGCWRKPEEIYAYRQVAKYSGLQQEQGHGT